MPRTKIPAHVSERLVNRIALRYTQLDNAQKNNDTAAADKQVDLLKNTFWVLDSIGFDKSVIERVQRDALDEAGLKHDPMESKDSGGGGGGKKPGKGSGGGGTDTGNGADVSPIVTEPGTPDVPIS